MAIEITRNLLQIEQIAGDEKTQILVDAEKNVPENSPDIVRILDVDGRISINSHEVIQDKVMLEGTIVYNILYLSDNDDRYIASMEVDTSFTDYIDISDVESSMKSRIFAEIEHINCDIINSRKLSLNSVMDVHVKVFDLAEVDVVEGTSGDWYVETLRESIELSYESEQGEGQTIVRESIELSDNMPTIVDILRKNINIKEIRSSATDNRVIVEGIMDIDFLYTCEDPKYPIHLFTEEIEFVHSVDIAGAYQNMDCRCDIHIDDFYLEAKEDLSGDMRLVDIEVLISIDVSTVESQYRDILIDAYMPDGALDLEMRELTIAEPRGRGQSQVSIKEIIEIPENMPKCDVVLYLNAQSSITDQKVDEDKIVVDGALSINILYQSQDSGSSISSLKQDIPFSQEIDIENIDEDMDCDCQIDIERTSFSLLAEDEIEIKVVLDAKIQMIEERVISAIIGLEESELPLEQQSGIFVYFTKPHDNLWSIAKRYNTTIENILRFNVLSEDDELEVGSRIVIYKRYDYKKDDINA